MKTLYFDCIAGASGDMILGALIDAGLDADWLRSELGKLPISGWKLLMLTQKGSAIEGRRGLMGAANCGPTTIARGAADRRSRPGNIHAEPSATAILRTVSSRFRPKSLI